MWRWVRLQEEWGMTSVEFRNGEWGAARGKETTKLDREILADIAGRQNELGLRWISLIHKLHAYYISNPNFYATEIWSQILHNQREPGQIPSQFQHWNPGAKKQGRKNSLSKWWKVKVFWFQEWDLCSVQLHTGSVSCILEGGAKSEYNQLARIPCRKRSFKHMWGIDNIEP